MTQSASTAKANLTEIFRASDWWEFKLSPMFATIYATALILQLPISSLWPLLLLALAALVPGAAYVSVINDLTDIKDDLLSGKRNRLIGKSSIFITLLLIACILPGVAISYYWRHDSLLLYLYLAAWLAFSLYSIPPLRFKTRGVLGLLADACGAHLFPTLLVVTLVFRWHSKPIDPLWFIAIGCWSMSAGLRGNLWHQLSDLQSDRITGARTFASRHNLSLLNRLGTLLIFPIELIAFAFMLWRAGSRLAVAFLCFYVLLQYARKRMWKMNLVIVTPKDRYSILMLEYYEFFFPFSVLLTSSLDHPRDLLIVFAHLIIFPKCALQTFKDVIKLLKQTLLTFL